MKNKLHDGLLATIFLALMMQGSFAYAEKTATAASTKKKEPLVITLTATKISKSVNGKEIFSNADKVKPGDVVEYKAKYENVSKAGLNAVIATLPVPKGMEYLDKTANPASATATADDVKYDAVPLKRKVKDKTGKEVTTLVPVSEYRSLRWSLGDIQAGRAMVVSARMRVAK